jgi:phage terminase large subunit-like protein
VADETIIDVPECWIRNAADRRAVERGARWCEDNGNHFLRTTTSNFRLYEGAQWAGKLIVWQDWQEDFWRRLFSWVVWSEFYGRWVRRFKRARLWVAKKNGKSPMGAACGLYLTIADGEMGGKTFSAAHDSKQASIIHDHAINMVRMSPELSGECVINLTNKRITHTRTNTWYGVISSDHEGQEGLNGNAIIDEGHVVDARLAKVLEYMGASREEPLELMVSTAGDKLDGWGKQQWDYGEQVNKGDIDDVSLLHVAYCAPQNATDEELITNREYWKAANPSLGSILDPERFEQEMLSARKVPTKWTTFKKYRFNIWQSSSTPWLDGDDWNANITSKDEVERLAGMDGYLGLDMSLARDMTAINLIIPVPRDDYEGDSRDPEAKVYYQLPKMWITSAAVDRWSHLVPHYGEWAEAGHLEIQEGRQLYFTQIVEDIIEYCKPYKVQSVTFDPAYAQMVSEQLAERLSCDRIEFRQTIMEYLRPTQMYERLLKLRLLRHFNHPVLNWMAGHVNVTRPDRAGNYRPTKPRVAGIEEAHKAIDGIVAGVMAIREASNEVVYEYKPGVMTL